MEILAVVGIGAAVALVTIAAWTEDRLPRWISTAALVTGVALLAGGCLAYFEWSARNDPCANADDPALCREDNLREPFFP